MLQCNTMQWALEDLYLDLFVCKLLLKPALINMEHGN